MISAIIKIMSLIYLLTSANIALAESVISKADVETIFKMNKAEWELTAPRYTYVGWDTKFKKLETGVIVTAFDKSTGYGLSIQPIYFDNKSGPSSLIVGSFYPYGTMSANFSDIKKDIESDSENDLGEKYKVTANYLKVSSKIEEIALNITQKTKSHNK